MGSLSKVMFTSYVTVVAVCGAAAIAWSVPQVGWPEAVATATAVFVAEALASTLRDGARVSMTNVVVLVAMLLGGAPLAIAATLGAIPAFIIQSDVQRLTKTAFNGGQFALSAAAGGLTYQAIVAAGGAAPTWGLRIGAITVAAAAYSVANQLLVSIVLRLVTTEPFWSTFRSMATALALQIPYVGIAVLAAVLVEGSTPWAVALMAVPIFLARSGLLAFERMDVAQDHLVRQFVQAIEAKDLYTRGHSERVAELSVHVAEDLRIPYEQRRLTRYAALLHDVGKVGVPGCVINKPGRLNDDEFELVKQHPTIGAEILRDIDFLEPAIDIVRYHHERLDGCGYPHGVAGDELSDIVRIVTVADAFDAMTSTRSYRRALPVADAVAELRACAGTQFDSRMVEALARVVDRIDWQPTVDFATRSRDLGASSASG